MDRCPSCAAAVPPGETICMECGTDLVVLPEELEAADAERAPELEATETATLACPDCGESVSPDANRLCPICGHDFQQRFEIDEDAFFAEPLSLDEQRQQRREQMREQDVPSIASHHRDQTPWEAHRGARSDLQPSTQRPSLPLPGDRRARYRADTGAHDSVATNPPARLLIEGGQKVFFDGCMVSEIPLDVDALLVGRRDPADGHYPDVDLAHFRHIDPHVSRHHARFLKKSGRWTIEDLCANDATFLNDRAHVLNGERVQLQDGDRILISDSIAMTFRVASRRHT